MEFDVLPRVRLAELVRFLPRPPESIARTVYVRKSHRFGRGLTLGNLKFAHQLQQRPPCLQCGHPVRVVIREELLLHPLQQFVEVLQRRLGGRNHRGKLFAG
jgi:hypothetical protein